MILQEQSILTPIIKHGILLVKDVYRFKKIYYNKTEKKAVPHVKI